MNNPGKRIEVNASSLLDLKAELIRKQEEYRKSKLANGNVQRPKPAVKKPNIWSKQNTGVAERGKADLHYEETPEEQDALKKSRQALEAKAKLYDKLTSGNLIPDEEPNSSYLVNFQRKAIDNVKQKMLEEENEKNKAKEANEALVDDIPASCPEEEWVDYVDALGRSRRCLRKDLPNLLEMDKKLGIAKLDEPALPTVIDPKKLHLLSDDKQREFRRKKWEEEAEAALSKPVGPVHYQTVQHEEIRNHGVGYFAFSQDELERKTQLEALNNLRNQTQDQRTRREILKQKRKEQLKSRLAKVKQRQKQKLGIEGDSSEEDDALNNSSDNETNQEVKTVEETPSEAMIGPLPQLPEEAKVLKVRPWDKGKIGVRIPTNKPPEKKLMTQDEWIENQRSDRQADFAPPQFYYNTRPCFTQTAVRKSSQPFFQSTSNFYQPFAQPFTIASNTTGSMHPATEPKIDSSSETANTSLPFAQTFSAPSNAQSSTASMPADVSAFGNVLDGNVRKPVIPNPIHSIPLPVDPGPQLDCNRGSGNFEEQVSAMLAFYKEKSS